MSQKFDNFNFFPQFVNPQGGAPGTITIEQGGIPVSGSPVSGLNFTGSVSTITVSGGVATVNVTGGGGGTPGGSNGEIQYNASGAFGGSAVTTDGTNLNLNSGSLRFDNLNQHIVTDNDGGINFIDEGGYTLQWNAWDNNGLQLNGANLVMGTEPSSGGTNVYLSGASVYGFGGFWALNDGSGSGGGNLLLDAGQLQFGSGAYLQDDGTGGIDVNGSLTFQGGSSISESGGNLTILQGNGIDQINMGNGNGIIQFQSTTYLDDAGDLFMAGQSVFMNNGSGSGGGTLNMDGGAFYGSASGSGQPGNFNLGDGSGVSGGTLNLDNGTIVIDSVGTTFGNIGGDLTITGSFGLTLQTYLNMVGNNINMNDGSGSGGGSIVMDGTGTIGWGNSGNAELSADGNGNLVVQIAGESAISNDNAGNTTLTAAQSIVLNAYNGIVLPQGEISIIGGESINWGDGPYIETNGADTLQLQASILSFDGNTVLDSDGTLYYSNGQPLAFEGTELDYPGTGPDVMVLAESGGGLFYYSGAMLADSTGSLYLGSNSSYLQLGSDLDAGPITISIDGNKRMAFQAEQGFSFVNSNGFGSGETVNLNGNSLNMNNGSGSNGGNLVTDGGQITFASGGWLQDDDQGGVSAGSQLYAGNGVGAYIYYSFSGSSNGASMTNDLSSKIYFNDNNDDEFAWIDTSNGQFSFNKGNVFTDGVGNLTLTYSLVVGADIQGLSGPLQIGSTMAMENNAIYFDTASYVQADGLGNVTLSGNSFAINGATTFNGSAIFVGATSAPATPATNNCNLWFDSTTKKLHFVDGTGTDHIITST